MGGESSVVREESSVKKVRAAAVIAVVTTVVSQARDYARDNPDQAAEAVDQVERFLKGRLPPAYGAYVGRGGSALRQGLGLVPRATGRAAGAPGGTELTDPDPDTTEPPVAHGFRDPVAPNPSPGTSDDPQPRRWDDDPAPLTPGERPHH
jgi:hypothetical protein